MTIVCYECEVTPTDEISCYVTCLELAGIPLFALVATNEQDDKVSVLLNYEKAQQLINQLTDFMMKGVYD